MSEHEDWRFRGAVYSAMQGHGKAITELLEMLADEQRQLTHQDRLALKGYIEYLTSKPKRGRRPGKAFSRAWLVRQFAEEARRKHKSCPGRSLPELAEEAVKHWGVAERARLTAKYEAARRESKLAMLEEQISGLITTVQTELRGRGVATGRRAKRSQTMQR